MKLVQIFRRFIPGRASETWCAPHGERARQDPEHVPSEFVATFSHDDPSKPVTVHLHDRTATLPPECPGCKAA